MRPSIRVLLSIGCLLILANMFVEYRGGIRYGDMQYFQSMAERAAAGDLRTGYPFLSTILFVLVAHNPFQTSFEVGWAVALLASYLFVVFYTIAFLDANDAAWLLIATTLSTFLLHPILLFGRLEGFTMMILFLVWKTWQRHRVFQCGLWLFVGIAFKFSPVFLLPLFLFALTSRDRWRFLLGMGTGLLMLSVLAAITTGLHGLWENTAYLITFRGTQPVDASSSLSAIDTLVRWLTGLQPMIGKVPNDALTYWNLSFPGWVATILSLLAVAGATAIAFFARRTLRVSRDAMPLFMLIILIWLLSVSPTFSPHYLFWVLPLVFMWLFERAEEQGKWTWNSIILFSVAAGAGVATRWIYPEHYAAFLTGTSPSVILVHNFRTILLLALLYFLYQRSKQLQVEVPSTGI